MMKNKGLERHRLFVGDVPRSSPETVIGRYPLPRNGRFTSPGLSRRAWCVSGPFRGHEEVPPDVSSERESFPLLRRFCTLTFLVHEGFDDRGDPL